MVAGAPVSRLFVLRHDKKFLRHIKRALGTGDRMEQRWSGPLCLVLGLATRGACLFESLHTQFSLAKDVIVHMRRLRLGISVTVTLVLLVVSCCSTRESSLLRLVPAESCAIMSIDWPSLKDESELKRVIKSDHFDALLRELALDSESIKTMVVFSAIDGVAMSGLLLRGSFDSKEIARELKETGWTENKLKGHKVYMKAADYVAMLSGQTLFAGTRDGALAVFRASDNSEESIVESDAYQKINAVISKNRSPVKTFLLIPQGTLDMADAALAATSFALSIFDLGGIGQLLQAVTAARGFGFSLDQRTGDMYPVELCVLMRDEQSAVFVSGSLNALKTVSELAATDTRDLEQLRAIRQMRVVRKQEVLAVKMEIPRAALFPPNSTNTGRNK